MASGTWDGIEQKVLPGIYYKLDEAAAAITGGERGVVAIPVFKFTGSAKDNTFYTVESEKEAVDLFGADGAKPVVAVLAGGSMNALVYTAKTLDSAEPDYVTVRDVYEARDFNMFVYPSEVKAAEQDAFVAWLKRNREEGKHFLTVFGGTKTEDADPSIGNARSIRVKDDYVVNLVNGGIDGEGNELYSGIYAPYIAGKIAGTPINKSLTNAELPLADVNKRFKNSELREALKSGSLVLSNSGNSVIITQAITTSKADSKRGKIRRQSGAQAIFTDISTTVGRSYIGKVDNDEAGQTAIISAIKLYLEQLEKQSVLTDINVELDPNYVSEDDRIYVLIEYRELDSAEFVYLTINV